MIGLPGPEPGRFEEWGYAERGWYLDSTSAISTPPTPCARPVCP